jgi:GNAT superfamily N-acetyltransferase
LSGSAPAISIVTLADRPDLAERLDDFDTCDIAPFLYRDAITEAFYRELVAHHPEFSLVAVDPADPGVPLGKLCTAPFSWPGDPARDLPADGYDAVFLSAAADLLAGRRGNLVSPLIAMVQPQLRGRGLASRLLAAARRNTARLGYRSLVAPVRPTRKHLCQDVPMARYAERTGPDGLPADPWLRVHVRAGARIVGLAPRSVTITGTLDEWRAWTGLPFDVSGPVAVPGGLVPVHCDVEHGVATYVEPNIWVHHAL